MNKKAISSVISTVLLLLVAISAVISFQGWFQLFSSSTLTSVEQRTSSFGSLTVEGVNGGILYIKGKDSIQSVQVNGNDCFISGLTDTGINSLPFSDCFSEGENEIVIITRNNVISKKIFIENYDYVDPCPSGYVLVPGNIDLGTKNFCVMKYEAKATNESEVNLFDSTNMYCGDGVDGGGGTRCPTDGSVNVTSKAESNPLTQIYQTEARQLCSNLGPRYSLITDAQWITIARNTENVASNWADNVIGSTVAGGGGLKRGNVGMADSVSYNAIPDPADRSLDLNSLAMLNLSNGESIWDLSGNVWEWTNNTFDTNAQSSLGQTTSGWYEITEIINYEYLKPYNSLLNSTHGIGRINADVDDASPSGTTHGFFRGGSWVNLANAGVFALLLNRGPLNSISTLGFRCSYAP